MNRECQPHPVEAIEAARAAHRRAVNALAGEALAEVRRQLPGLDLTANRFVAWWREGRPEAIGIESRQSWDEPSGAWRWRWEAWAAEHYDVVGYGDTIREALEDLARRSPAHAPVVAELLAEVTP